MNELTRLTEAQRDFAEKNHDLVHRYLRMKGLREDDYYDIAVFGYLRAAQIYDQRPELQKYSFQTIAFKRMYAALWNHFRNLRTAKRSADVLSLNAPGMGGLDLAEHFTADAPAVYEYAEARERWEAVRAAATPKQMQALDMRARGYTSREIGRVYHLSPSSVSGRICRLRKKTMRLAA